MTKKTTLNSKEAADFIGLAEPTLRSKRCNGDKNQPRYHRSGGRIVYRLTDLEEYMNKNCVDPEHAIDI